MHKTEYATLDNFRLTLFTNIIFSYTLDLPKQV
jgi:hypothetical protein